jgi:hypothetical protein
VCGADNLEDWRFMYYPDPDNLDFSLCISACPYYYIRNYYCIYDTDYSTLRDRPCYDTVESTVIGFYCVPEHDEYREEVMDHLYSSMQIIKRSAGDLWLAWDVMIVSASVSGCLGFVYLSLLKFPRIA